MVETKQWDRVYRVPAPRGGFDPRVGGVALQSFLADAPREAGQEAWNVEHPDEPGGVIVYRAVGKPSIDLS